MLPADERIARLKASISLCQFLNEEAETEANKCKPIVDLLHDLSRPLSRLAGKKTPEEVADIFVSKISAFCKHGDVDSLNEITHECFSSQDETVNMVGLLLSSAIAGNRTAILKRVNGLLEDHSWRGHVCTYLTRSLPSEFTESRMRSGLSTLKERLINKINEPGLGLALADLRNWQPPHQGQLTEEAKNYLHRLLLMIFPPMSSPVPEAISAEVVLPASKKGRAGMPRAVAEQKARELGEKSGDTFIRSTLRSWAKEIGCSPTTVLKLTYWIDNKPKLQAHSTGKKAHSLPSHIGYATADKLLGELVKEQQGDYEPSPFEETAKPVRHRKSV